VTTKLHKMLLLQQRGRTEEGRDAGRVGFMLRWCVKFAKMHHGEIVKEN